MVAMSSAAGGMCGRGCDFPAAITCNNQLNFNSLHLTSEPAKVPTNAGLTLSQNWINHVEQYGWVNREVIDRWIADRVAEDVTMEWVAILHDIGLHGEG